VSALIVIIGVMDGLQHDLREKILVGSPDIRVLSYGSDLKIQDWRDVLGKVRRHPGVVAAEPFVLTEAGMNAGRDYAGGVMLVGLPPQTRGATEVTSIRSHVKSGDFRFASSDGQRRGAVLGNLLALRFNAWPGDKINLISIANTKINAATGTFVPSVYELEVTGIAETGMYEYDDRYVYIDLALASEFAGLGESVTGIEVRTIDRWEASRVATELTQMLGFPYRTVDWEEQNRSLFQALKLEKLGMGVILLLIVIVAAFNIVSTLTMVVTDKTREIGILRAMGMPAGSIRRIFFAQGVFIGMVGTAFGVIVGLTAAISMDRYKLIALDPAIYFIDHLPVMTSPMDVLWIVLASLAIAAVATLYPSIQASRLYPLEAIRHE
ncbi:MAG: ABC transporter permease, partial [Gemmatimonadaceae bacterium]